MVSIEEFMQNVRERTSDTHHLQAADAFELLLKGEADADDTERSITMIYEVDLKRNNGSTYVDCHNKVNAFFLDQIIGAIQCFGDAAVQQLLIDLLVRIRKQPDVKTPDRSVEMHRGVEAYWRDVLGWSFAFTYHGLGYNHPFVYGGPSGKEDFIAQAPGILNATKFAAKLLEIGEFTKGLPQVLVLFMRDATEQTCDEEAWEDMERDHRQFLAPLAATSLLVAGKTIYSHCRNDEIAVPDGDRKGWAAYSWTKQLWAHWKKKFQDFAAREDFSEECRNIASQAVRKMEEIESGDQDSSGVMRP